jgi:L-threonylcarbamoyladenylate synthase
VNELRERVKRFVDRSKSTTVWHVDPQLPDPVVIGKAADVLRAGDLVAFPTETVYGLGANGLDANAVARIYAAKGRPGRNPIILHVASTTDAQTLVKSWPPSAQSLAGRFWPGPLTLVLPRLERVPDIVTAGGPTVAVRWPTHPIAQALIAALGGPIAAPSANRSGELSPTCAEHVLNDLDGRIDLLLDGGPTAAGIESTVIDLSGPVPRLLRPGPIPPVELESIIGPLIRNTRLLDQSALPSPGMLERHYAPRTPLESFAGYAKMVDRSIELWREGKRIAMMFFGNEATDTDQIIRVPMPGSPADYAAQLYRVLHDLDRLGLDRILVQMPPASDDWLAVRDRLQRATMR